jgi:hypothetical protein
MEDEMDRTSRFNDTDVRYMKNNLVATPDWRRPSGTLRCSCKDNIKMYLREMGCEGVD